MTPNPQYIILFHHFRRVLMAAAAEKIPMAPLKGAHLLTSVYPVDEGRGTIADVDFLVHPDHWERTLTLMTGLGFVEAPRTHRHEAAFLYHFDDGRKVLFEAHKYLFEPRRVPIDHDALWARARPSMFEGAPCLRLSDEDHFCHIAFHGAVHRLMHLGVTHRDLQLVLIAGDADLPARIVQRAQEWKTTRAVWLFLRLLAAGQTGGTLGPATRALAPPTAVRGALRYLVPDASGTRVAGLHHRVQAAILWPLLFDSPTALAKMVANHPLLISLRSSLAP